MMAWVAASGGVKAVGDAGDVTIHTGNWQDCTGTPALPRPAEETITGAVSKLTVPVTSTTLTDAASRRRYDMGGGAVLSEGEYLLECTLSIGDGFEDRPDTNRQNGTGARMISYIRFSGPTKVTVDSGTATVMFPDPTPVTIGFSEWTDDPATITIPESPDGVATALTHLSAALRTTGPERSHPSLRDHPPVVEVGDAVSIPEAVKSATPETGITLELPASLEYLFVSAPLAYYLGANVTVSDRQNPKLVAPEGNVEYRFRQLPAFQCDVSRLLRRVFCFDTLVRGSDSDTVSQPSAVADAFQFDPAHIRQLSPAERLARYLWVQKADLESALPEWHFSTYAAPEMQNARSLPYLLDALSLIYLPESSELRETELLERTLDDFYREGRTGTTQVPSVDVVKPELRAGRVHAWLAPGAPIDAFKTTTQAYENRRKYRDRGTPLSVTVVLNDEEMSDEHAAVADIYRERAADLPISVTVREHLTRDELADVFTSPNDFVHYIGHCDANGLKCTDHNLSASSLSEVRTRTFFLNACGSYHEGVELVERGSVAGAVTLTKVLNRQAAKVGTAFARLLVNGFGLEPAMQLSRRRIMMGKDYAVVGDGTYTLAPTPGSPIIGWLTELDNRYQLTCEALTARRNGDTFQLPFTDESYLHGTTAQTVLDSDDLLSFLEETSLPIIYDNEFHWSDDLVSKLLEKGDTIK